MTYHLTSAKCTDKQVVIWIIIAHSILQTGSKRKHFTKEQKHVLQVVDVQSLGGAASCSSASVCGISGFHGSLSSGVSTSGGRPCSRNDASILHAKRVLLSHC